MANPRGDNQYKNPDGLSRRKLVGSAFRTGSNRAVGSRSPGKPVISTAGPPRRGPGPSIRHVTMSAGPSRRGPGASARVAIAHGPSTRGSKRYTGSVRSSVRRVADAFVARAKSRIGAVTDRMVNNAMAHRVGGKLNPYKIARLKDRSVPGSTGRIKANVRALTGMYGTRLRAKARGVMGSVQRAASSASKSMASGASGAASRAVNASSQRARDVASYARDTAFASSSSKPRNRTVIVRNRSNDTFAKGVASRVGSVRDSISQGAYHAGVMADIAAGNSRVKPRFQQGFGSAKRLKGRVVPVRK